MFTGIVEKKAKVAALRAHRGGKRLVLRVPAGWDKLPLGTSVAVDGACLTVSARRRGELSFDLLKETLRRTRFGRLVPGQQVNLERAMRHGKRFEGHFVQGHVDGPGKVLEVRSSGSERTLTVAAPKAVVPYLVPKGSIALNGVSLTVGKVLRGSFQVHLIPYTLRHTGLGELRKGDTVHLEADALLKFFRRLTSTHGHYKLMPSTLAARKWADESI